MKDIQRKLTRTVTAGNVKIGGGNPISVQSMTNTPAHDIAATADQIERLANADAILCVWRCRMWKRQSFLRKPSGAA